LLANPPDDDHVPVRRGLIVAVAAVLAGLACATIWSAFRDPVVWTPDALYYQANLLELRGVDHDAAIDRTFEGPLSAELRGRDPHHTGNPTWVAFNEPFYERRVALPLAGAALYPIAGDRSLLDISLVGYIAAILALFGFLLLRFRLGTAAIVSAAAVFLAPLSTHSSFPLTDSWGVALLITAFAAAFLTLDRGLRWLPLYRTRVPVWLFVAGLAAALPAPLLFTTPVRELLALAVNGSEPAADPSWWFIARHYPGAIVDLVRANVGFLRRGEWYTALFLVGGVSTLFALAWRRRPNPQSTVLMVVGAVFGVLYVLAGPVFSAFRLELVAVPMAAYGLALAVELVAARVTRAELLQPRLRSLQPGHTDGPA
jgi:hypothetical protein